MIRASSPSFELLRSFTACIAGGGGSVAGGAGGVAVTAAAAAAAAAAASEAVLGLAGTRGASKSSSYESSTWPASAVVWVAS